MLEKESKTVRLAAVRSAGKLAQVQPSVCWNKTAVSTLVKAMESIHTEVHRDAVEAVGVLGLTCTSMAEEAMRKLEKALQDDIEDVRYVAVDFMGKLCQGSPDLAIQYTEQLVRALEDKSTAVHCAAVKAIGGVLNGTKEEVARKVIARCLQVGKTNP